VTDAVTIPEPISPVKDFLANSQKLLIDGKRVDAVSGETFEVLDPSKNTVLTLVSKGEKEDINRAFKAARNVFKMDRGKLT
jgi:acyl-CoA reductase-like NAD-dependent aldehyde dehydrogenase